MMKPNTFGLLLLTLGSLAGCAASDAADGIASVDQSLVATSDQSAAVKGFRVSELNAAVPLRNLRVDNSSIKKGAVRKLGDDSGLFVNGEFSTAKLFAKKGELTRPYNGSADEHGNAIKQVFLAAGLPDEQIASVDTGVTVRASASASDPESVTRELESYTTVIKRQVDGIPVTGSHAIGRMDHLGRVTLQTTYWPPIPRAVINDAVALRNRSDNARGKLVAELVRNHPHLAEGSVSKCSVEIRLTSPRTTQTARAVLRVPSDSPNNPDTIISSDGTTVLE